MVIIILPINSASCERSFSIFYLRTVMSNYAYDCFNNILILRNMENDVQNRDSDVI